MLTKECQRSIFNRLISGSKEIAMAKKPGESTGKDGGIYQEVGPRGGKKDNFATVADNKHLPPTSDSGNQWELIKRTPNSKK